MTLGWRNPPFAYLTAVLTSLSDTQHNCGMPTIGSFMLYSGAGILGAFSRHAPDRDQGLVSTLGFILGECEVHVRSSNCTACMTLCTRGLSGGAGLWYSLFPGYHPGLRLKERFFPILNF
ncbi:hypothetical protein EDB86DRAFT_1822816 [Lactarius hatsudake]|nr:hypothetical protein EDB86DRAFT_1822816 [Lactarius hatsudake]